MATALSTARPPHAAIAWATRDGLYCEIPCRSGPPLICRYRLTPEGLQSALNALLEAPDHSPRSALAPHPATRRPIAAFDEGQRAGVRDVLKKAGII